MQMRQHSLSQNAPTFVKKLLLPKASYLLCACLNSCNLLKEKSLQTQMNCMEWEILWEARGEEKTVLDSLSSHVHQGKGFLWSSWIVLWFIPSCFSIFFFFMFLEFITVKDFLKPLNCLAFVTILPQFCSFELCAPLKPKKHTRSWCLLEHFMFHTAFGRCNTLYCRAGVWVTDSWCKQNCCSISLAQFQIFCQETERFLGKSGTLQQIYFTAFLCFWALTYLRNALNLRWNGSQKCIVYHLN